MSGSAAIPRIVALSIVAMFGAELTQAIAWAGAARQASNTQTAEQLIKASDCASCHAADRTVVGPAYAAIAKKYAGTAGAAARLALRIRDGGAGTWGDAKMPPHADLTDAQRQTIARYILAVKDAPAVSGPRRAKVCLRASRWEEDHARLSALCRRRRKKGDEGYFPRLRALQLVLLSLPRDRRHRERTWSQPSPLPRDRHDPAAVHGGGDDRP